MTKELTNRLGFFPCVSKDILFFNISFHKQKHKLLRAFDVFAVIYASKMSAGYVNTASFQRT
jgi:hypothetical protein